MRDLTFADWLETIPLDHVREAARDLRSPRLDGYTAYLLAMRGDSVRHYHIAESGQMPEVVINRCKLVRRSDDA